MGEGFGWLGVEMWMGGRETGGRLCVHYGHGYVPVRWDVVEEYIWVYCVVSVYVSESELSA